MKFKIPEGSSMESNNFNQIWNNNIAKFNHHSNLPNSFRMFIIGLSSSVIRLIYC